MTAGDRPSIAAEKADDEQPLPRSTAPQLLLGESGPWSEKIEEQP
jgi:hypothetical protein